MNEQTIDLLCEKFHTTVDNLIPVYAKYAMMKDITSGIFSIIIMAICVAIIIILYKRGQRLHYYDDILYTPFRYLLGLVLAGATILICLIIICSDIYSYIMWYNFPEMRFLDFLVSM